MIVKIASGLCRLPKSPGIRYDLAKLNTPARHSTVDSEDCQKSYWTIVRPTMVDVLRLHACTCRCFQFVDGLAQSAVLAFLPAYPIYYPANIWVKLVCTEKWSTTSQQHNPTKHLGCRR